MAIIDNQRVGAIVRPDCKLGKITITQMGKYFASQTTGANKVDGWNVIDVKPQQLTATERDFLAGNTVKCTQVLDETITDLKAILAPVFPNLSTLVIGNAEQVVTGLDTALAGLNVTVVVPNSLLSAYQTAYASATNLTFTSWQFQHVFTIPYIG